MVVQPIVAEAGAGAEIGGACHGTTHDFFIVF
jgi:hypothetical protein